MSLPSDPRARRRRAGLLAVALAALVSGAVAGRDGDERSGPSAREPAGDVPAAGGRATGRPADAPDQATERPLERTRERLRRLPAGKLAGEVVILRFSGPSVPAHVTRAMRRGWAAGAILFRDNATDPATTRRLTRQLQRAAGGDALICADQEGGAVRVLPWIAPASGQSTQPAPGASARAAARGLESAGVNVSLAPVADLGGPGPVMRTRAFAGGPAQVARAVRGAVRGYRGTRVAPTAKHFPGLGAAAVNTDDAAATIERGARALGAADLPPFSAAIAAGAPLVMMSHARYPALDPRRIASQSRPIVSDLLRRRLGFQGVVMTDSLEAAAVRAVSTPAQAAVRSIGAGVDLILLTGAGSHVHVTRALAAQARRSEAFRARLVDAAARVRLLRQRLSG